MSLFVGYVSDRAGSVVRIREILARGLVSAAGENLFAGRFAHLAASRLTAEPDLLNVAEGRDVF